MSFPADTVRPYLRQQILSRRASYRPWDKRIADRRRTSYLLDWIDQRYPSSSTIACYLATKSEPDTLSLLEALYPDYDFLIPRMDFISCQGDLDQPSWSSYDPILRYRGRYGIDEIDSPHLGVEAISRAHLIIVPALAVGPDGSRLGRGGGWYDRALVHRNPKSTIVALIGADEYRPIASYPHDIPVDWVATQCGMSRCRHSWTD